MIDWKIDISYGLLGVWYTYTNLYLYVQYKHFEIIDSICSLLAYNDNNIMHKCTHSIIES